MLRSSPIAGTANGPKGPTAGTAGYLRGVKVRPKRFLSTFWIRPRCGKYATVSKSGEKLRIQGRYIDDPGDKDGAFEYII